MFGISFADGGGKSEQAKEPEAVENKEQPEDKKVRSNHFLGIITKPRSHWCLELQLKAEGLFGLLCSLVLISLFHPTRQEDVPAGDDGSGGSEDSDSDDNCSDEDSDESSEEEDDEEEEEEDENEDEPLSLEWPDTRRKQATYLFLLPIVFPLWLTVPDVRNQVRYTHISEISCGISEVCRLTGFAFTTGIQKILCGLLSGLNYVDRCFLLSHGVVGPSGQLTQNISNILKIRFETLSAAFLNNKASSI